MRLLTALLFALLFPFPLPAQEPDRPYLAMDLRELNEAEAKKMGLGSVKDGLAVVRTHIGGPARLAGVLPMDILFAIDEKKVRTRDAYRDAMTAHKIGDEVTLSIMRKGTPIDIKVKLVSKNDYDAQWVLKGKPMPDLVVDSWIGDAPKDLKGSVAVIEFWNAGSAASRNGTLPRAGSLVEKFGDKGLRVVAIHSSMTKADDKSADDVKQAIAELRLKLPVGLDARKDGDELTSTLLRFKADDLPLVVVVDKKGVVRLTGDETTNQQQIEALIESLLKE